MSLLTAAKQTMSCCYFFDATLMVKMKESTLGFATSQPPHTTAQGLFQSLQYGLQCLGIQSVNKEECSKLVGIVTDGAAANIAANGLKGLVEKDTGST